ncbi:hypothetical protein IIY59_01650 [Candidatus Saccharibacteria bacterium]|nr:hypothetical protein [Candidatus Saccharibacteria bacterium]
MNGKIKKKTQKEGTNINLGILAVAAALIALITTSISLYIYKATGDIYIDRSRPGYISKEEEGKVSDDGSKKTSVYEFSSEGEINQKVLKKYLEKFESIQTKTQDPDSDFNETPLSDESLGIKPE